MALVPWPVLVFITALVGWLMRKVVFKVYVLLGGTFEPTEPVMWAEVRPSLTITAALIGLAGGAWAVAQILTR